MSIDLENIQNTLDYQFKNEELLQQAFVRRSYSEEHGGQNNEVLEFIGDKALDLVVIKQMMERFGTFTTDKKYEEFKLRNPKYFTTKCFTTKYNEGKFTDIKKDLVQKKMLAHCIDELGFNQHLIMGNGDINQNIHEQDSVKEDLFEAIIGAITLDCNWNLEIIENCVVGMLDLDDYFCNDFDEDDNYVGLLQEYIQKKYNHLPSYSYIENEDEFTCRLDIDELGYYFTGSDDSKSKARKDCAYNAYQWLMEKGYLAQDSIDEMREIVGKPSINSAINQLQELAQKGYIDYPEYEFTSEGPNNDIIWTCRCSINGYEYYYENSSSNKKEAKKMSAYDMLCDALGQ